MDGVIPIIVFFIGVVLLWLTMASAKSTADYYNTHASYRDNQTTLRIREELMAVPEDNTASYSVTGIKDRRITMPPPTQTSYGIPIRIGGRITQDHPGALYTFTPTYKPMKLTTFEQAKEHYRMGYYSLVKDEDDDYCILSFPTRGSGGCQGFFRSDRVVSVENALNNHDITNVSTGERQINEWTMVRAVHPSEFMGGGFKVGDKVVLKEDSSKTVREIYKTPDDGNHYYYLVNGYVAYTHAQLVPAPFEKADSQAVLDAIELLKREGKLVDGKVLNA